MHVVAAPAVFSSDRRRSLTLSVDNFVIAAFDTINNDNDDDDGKAPSNAYHRLFLNGHLYTSTVLVSIGQCFSAGVPRNLRVPPCGIQGFRGTAEAQ